MPFPFLFLVVSLAAGIFVASLMSWPILVPFSFMAVALICAFLAYWRHYNRLSMGFLLGTTFFLGLVVYTHQDHLYENNALRRFDLPAYADFTGHLYRSPSFGQGVTFLYLKVEKIRFQNREEKVKGNLLVSIHHPEQYPSPLRLRAGEMVCVAA